jgi:hypothetical protein
LIDRYVSRFFFEVVPEHFRHLAAEGLDQIKSSVLLKAHEEASNMGIRSQKGAKRSPLGTMVSDDTENRLLVIEKWIGSNRQEAVEACLVYGLRILGRPNPHRGDLARVLFPPLAMSQDLELDQLRRIVENEIS